MSATFVVQSPSILGFKSATRRKLKFDDSPKCIYYHIDEPVSAVVCEPKREHALYRVNPQYQHPMVRLDELRLVEANACCGLEGFVHVSNLAYHKSVTARVSFDNWRSFLDYDAIFIQSLGTANLDLFKFSFIFNSKSSKEFTKFEIAIRYRVGQQEFWDNNAEANHVYLMTWIDS